ncbi:MAG: glutathione S-transferase C-terminal domain-containing protein [Rhodobiaceae bacterium]|nr:glutathione S-transferase C-terminal domain-containing protein [Rhodobiaceae bacterium]MCC0050107.1 glutathione S-transferase C-terminal domain-containing protein [Rhodobiaceae bacterium]
MMKLYYLPGSCALAAHICLEHAKADYQAVRIERGYNRTPEYLAINPFGSVPTLETGDGRRIFENSAVLLHIGDNCGGRLAPPIGSPERDDLHALLSYMTTTVHPAFAALWRPERFAAHSSGHPLVEEAALTRLKAAFEWLNARLGLNETLLGGEMSVVDAMLFVLCRWGYRIMPSTEDYEHLHAFCRAKAEMPAVRAAMEEEQIDLLWPKQGLG